MRYLEGIPLGDGISFLRVQSMELKCGPVMMGIALGKTVPLWLSCQDEFELHSSLKSEAELVFTTV